METTKMMTRGDLGCMNGCPDFNEEYDVNNDVKLV